MAFVGIGVAYALYARGPSKAAASWAKRFGPLHALSKGKYYIDELYQTFIFTPLHALSNVLWQGVDNSLINDLGVHGVAGTVGVTGSAVRSWHNGSLRRYLATLLFGFLVVLGAVYFNPRVAQVGPNVLNSSDPGGLRPELGGVPVDWSRFWYRNADAPARPAAQPKTSAVRPDDPARPPRVAPGSAGSVPGGGAR